MLSKGLLKSHNRKVANRRLVLEKLLEDDILNLLKVYWKAVSEAFEKKRSTAPPGSSSGQLWEHYTTAQKNIVEALGNCYYIMIIVWNGSDMKIPETLKLLYDGIVEFILARLDTDLHPINVTPTHPQYKVVKACFGILHNFCDKDENAVADLRERDALRIIGKYRNSGTSMLQMRSMLILAFLLTESDKNKSVIELEEKDIKFLIELLQDAMNSPGERSPKYGYTAAELIIGLNNIAIVDSNKKRLVDAGVLPIYVEAMTRKNPSLQESAVRGVWTLAFDDASVKKIKAEPRCMDGE